MRENVKVRNELQYQARELAKLAETTQDGAENREQRGAAPRSAARPTRSRLHAHQRVLKKVDKLDAERAAPPPPPPGAPARGRVATRSRSGGGGGAAAGARARRRGVVSGDGAPPPPGASVASARAADAAAGRPTTRLVGEIALLEAGLHDARPHAAAVTRDARGPSCTRA